MMKKLKAKFRKWVYLTFRRYIDPIVQGEAPIIINEQKFTIQKFTVARKLDLHYSRGKDNQGFIDYTKSVIVHEFAESTKNLIDWKIEKSIPCGSPSSIPDSMQLTATIHLAIPKIK